MHEMALCESVRDIIESEARDKGFQHVTSVHLEIGQLSGVDPEAMRFCFDAVMRDSVADGSTLEIHNTAGEGWCMVCAKNIAIAKRFEACSDCGSHQIQVVGGDQMRIKELEVK